jgi:hypothetical protein
MAYLGWFFLGLVIGVRRTEGVSAAFIKELMRRSAQFCVERNGDGKITHQDVDLALDEMLFTGGSLNRKLLGATEEGVESEPAFSAK